MYQIWQIENEYGPVEYELGAPGEAYTKWAAQMAVGLDTGVPWVMCKQDDAPDPIVCHPDFCIQFILFLLSFVKPMLSPHPSGENLIDDVLLL